MKRTLLGSWLLISCKKDELEASIAASPEVPMVGIVTIDGTEGTAYIEYGLDGDLSMRTPDDPTGDHHEIALLGLKASRTYEWRAVVTDANGVRHESETNTFITPDPPATLFPIEMVTASPDAEIQYALVSAICSSDFDCAPDTGYAAIFDKDGDWVWWVDTGGVLIVTPELGLDKKSVLFSTYDFGKYLDIGKLVRISLDGRTRTETRMKLGHHDFVQHDDGNIAFLSMIFDDFEFNDVPIRMASDAIDVGPEGMTEDDTPTRLWHMFDDFPLEPAATCSHVLSRGVELGQDDVSEWTHGNSFMYVPEEDAYYVNTKFTDWLYKIDRATGELLWVMNGRTEPGMASFTTPGGDPVWTDVTQTTLWSHGHMSDIWPGGGLMFDNGDHHTPPLSRAVEFAWDETAKTAEVVWEYPHPQAEHTVALGDVRRMPEGNVLITWAGLNQVDEVTKAGELLWQGIPQGNLVFGRIVPIADLYAP